MFQIIFYIVLAGVAFTAIHMFDLSRQKIGADAQLKADTLILNVCKSDRDIAVNANKDLQADVVRIGAERDQQSAAVNELADAMTKQAAARNAALAAAKPRIAALQADSGTLEQRLAANTEGKSCDEKLANVDRDLRALVGGGVRVVTPAADSREPSKKPPAGTRTGRGTLRLSQ